MTKIIRKMGAPALQCFKTLFLVVAALALVEKGVTAFAADAPNPPKYLMGVVGDSISTATFANTKMITAASNDNEPQPASDEDLLMQLGVRSEERVGTDNKLTLSWAAGNQISSHFARLQEFISKQDPNAQLSVINAAIAGETTKSAVAQVQQIKAAFEQGGYASLKYVTILLGNNDACHAVDAPDTYFQEMHDNLISALRELATIQQSEPIRVLLAAIPRIPDLGRKEIRWHLTLGQVTCDFFRNRVLKFCNFLTAWDSEDDFVKGVQIVTRVNALLQEVAGEAKQAFPNLDVHFSTKFFDSDIKPENLAMDCFHPAKEGQEELSRTLWQDLPWFK